MSALATAVAALGAEDDFAELIAPYITATSYKVPATMTFQRFCRALDILGKLRVATGWWIGDALVAAERLYGEEFMVDAIERVLGGRVNRETCLDYKYTCKHVPPDRRVADKLTISHHREVAPLAPAAQREWLEYAATHGPEGGPMPRAELRRVMRAQGVGDKGAGSPGEREPWPLASLKRAWNSAPEEQRRTFLEWTEAEWVRIHYRAPEEQLRVVGELRAALAEYGGHKEGCGVVPCSCGFGAVARPS